MGTLVNSEDPYEMQHNGAFYQGLNCLLLKIKTNFRDRNISSVPYLLNQY